MGRKLYAYLKILSGGIKLKLFRSKIGGLKRRRVLAKPLHHF